MTINKAIIIGSLGQKPTIGKTQNGKEYASFSVATTKKWKNQAGEKQEETTWHNISVWGNLVKICDYLDKSSKVYVEGEIKYEKYVDKKDGVEKQVTKIVANVIDIIKGKERTEIDKHSAAKADAYVVEDDDSINDTIPF